MKAEAVAILGIWHRYLDLNAPRDARIFGARERSFEKKGWYPPADYRAKRYRL